ncbi:MAG TPA: hypothetical protein H9695_15975 [Candidatus Mediterraneibacter excrementigallinarum]|nr:hypothetical protein [Candidatus Mediterraneibacter excrementigallinarum]
MAIELPEYTDGILRIYRIRNDDTKDFPEEYLEDMKMEVWFREISVFDKVKYEFDQGGKEVTMKLRIPQFKGIDSRCVCLIDGRQHLVYNATNVKDKYGFPETELTLVRPEGEWKICDKE